MFGIGMPELIVILVILLFLGNLRAVTAALASIPMVFFATLAIIWMTGGELNMVIYTAIILALGMLRIEGQCKRGGRALGGMGQGESREDGSDRRAAEGIRPHTRAARRRPKNDSR